MDKATLRKVKDFYSQFPARTWQAKQLIVQAYDEPAGIYFIEKGSVRQYVIDHRGEEVVVNSFHNPAFFPMSWGVKGTKNEYYFETAEDSVFRCAPKEEVLQFLEDNHDVTMDLLTRLYSGIDGILMRMVHLMSSSAHVRLVHELVLQARRLQSPSNKNIELPMKEYELGAFCGLTRETVSREFKKLKEQKLVIINKRKISIPDLAALEAVLDRQE